jgi:hypothetical protein
LHITTTIFAFKEITNSFTQINRKIKQVGSLRD